MRRMGLLDDAIREHLDLKRRRGADPRRSPARSARRSGPAVRDARESRTGDQGLAAAEPPTAPRRPRPRAGRPRRRSAPRSPPHPARGAGARDRPAAGRARRPTRPRGLRRRGPVAERGRRAVPDPGGASRGRAIRRPARSRRRRRGRTTRLRAPPTERARAPDRAARARTCSRRRRTSCRRRPSTTACGSSRSRRATSTSTSSRGTGVQSRPLRSEASGAASSRNPLCRIAQPSSLPWHRLVRSDRRLPRRARTSVRAPSSGRCSRA